MTTVIKWFDPREKLPEEDGFYLIWAAGNVVVPISRRRFTSNLHDFDDIDFIDRSFDHPGFVKLDESCFMWREIPLEEIKYWAKLPEIKEEN